MTINELLKTRPKRSWYHWWINLPFRLRWYTKDFFRSIKYAYQRVVKGYDDRALWNLNSYLIPIILPALRHLQSDDAMGYPMGFADQEAWNIELRKMIRAFELIEADSDWSPEVYQEVETGLSLFAQYYQTLWD